jgi:hypothetical protein
MLTKSHVGEMFSKNIEMFRKKCVADKAGGLD